MCGKTLVLPFSLVTNYTTYNVPLHALAFLVIELILMQPLCKHAPTAKQTELYGDIAQLNNKIPACGYSLKLQRKTASMFQTILLSESRSRNIQNISLL